MAYDNPLTALEDVGRMLRHLTIVIPAAAGAAPMVATYEKHLGEMRDKMGLPPRALAPLDPGEPIDAATLENQIDTLTKRIEALEAAQRPALPYEPPPPSAPYEPPVPAAPAPEAESEPVPPVEPGPDLVPDPVPEPEAEHVEPPPAV